MSRRDMSRWSFGRRAAIARAALLVATVLALGLSGCSRRGMPGADLPLTKLASDFEPLRSQFNRDAGKVRVLLLLDPT